MLCLECRIWEFRVLEIYLERKSNCMIFEGYYLMFSMWVVDVGSLILEIVEYRVKENYVVDMKFVLSLLIVVEFVVFGVGSILDSEVFRC